MLESMLDQLIAVYSAHTALDGSVHAAPAYVQLLETYSSSLAYRDAFDALRHRVERDKKELERQMREQTPQSQVRLALQGVRRRRAEQTEAQQGYVALAVRSYGLSWSLAQRDYFTTWADFIRGSQDYFLSFTERNPTPEFPIIVNRDHEFFIRSRIDNYDQHDRAKRNLLALALHYLLRQNLQTGFFFPKHDGPSYEVIPKLTAECARALVFIQLVQGVMFVGSPSYCGLEFEEARNSVLPKPFVFIDAETALPADDVVSPDLFDWYSFVKGSGRTHLLPTADSVDANVISGNHSLIKDKVIGFVKQATDAIYAGVPA